MYMYMYHGYYHGYGYKIKVSLLRPQRWRRVAHVAYRAKKTSPSADPRLDDSKHALISLNPQSPPRSLTAADVANEPGTPPLRVTTTRDVGEACGKVPRPLVEVGILFRDGYHCDSQARGRAAGV